MHKDAKIYIAGYPGLLGLALEQELKLQGFSNLLTPTMDDFDLRNHVQVADYFSEHKPEYVFLTAAKVGGIQDYVQFPVDFMQDNMRIISNVLAAAHQFRVTKLLFFSSACVYAEACAQPITESQLAEFALDAESEYYALPKLMGIRLCQAYQKQYGSNFISCIPVNLYGEHSILTGQGVGVALIRRLCDALHNDDVTFEVWGSGNQRREFLYVGDAARAGLFLMQHYTGPEPVNMGSGYDCTIGEFAALVAEIIGFKGKLIFDLSKPEGAQQRLLDSSKLFALGCRPLMSLEAGILHVATQYKMVIESSAHVLRQAQDERMKSARSS